MSIVKMLLILIIYQRKLYIELMMIYQNNAFLNLHNPLLKKWLRETKNLYIEIYRNACGYGYAIVKANNGTWMEDDDSKGPNDSGNWDTYEEALEAGLQEALELI